MALHVTDEQFQRIESLWEICSYGNARKTTGSWCVSFIEGVTQVLGFVPPENFSLINVGGAK